MLIQKPLTPIINWGHPLTKGLVFDSALFEHAGLGARDLVSNSVGVLTNTPTWGTHSKGTDVNFTDGGSAVILYTTKAFQNSVPFVTTESLIIPNVDNANDKRFVQKGPDAKYFALAYTSSKFQFSSSWGTQEGDWSTAANYSSLIAYHVVTTYSYSAVGNTPIIYVNGLNAGTLTVDLTPSGTTPVDDTELGVGNRTVTKNKAFGGAVVYTRYWNRLLTATEVKNLYSAPFQIYRQNAYKNIFSQAAASVITFITSPKPWYH